MVVVDQHGVWLQGEADIATRFRVAHEEVAELERFDTLEAALAAAGLTSNDLIPASRLQYVGYWFRTLDPRHLVDPQWARDERSALIRYLTDGHTLAECLGSSYCRFKCGIADSQTGCRDLTDGTWVWPEGLAHYVKAHNIMLPDELLAHARANGFEMPALDPLLAAELENPRRGYDLDLVVSDELWQRWGREHSHR